ncbi:hypothetical protein AB9E11_36170, partial [Rhizobium leguminosarum]
MGSAAKVLPIHWLPSRPVSGIIRSIHSARSIRSHVTIGFAHAELIAVLVAVPGDAPRVMTIRSGHALQRGHFEMGHLTL